MNIIKQIKDENGNNIYPIGYAQGGMKMDLLWTNPSPTSTFASQTVSLDLSGYDYIYIVYDGVVGSSKLYNSAFIPTSLPSYTFVHCADFIYHRALTISSSGIVFAGGKYTRTYGSSTFTDIATACVPIYIYGVKLSYIVPTSVHGLQYVEV